MEYIYTLKLIDRLFSKENWTEQDEKYTEEHFQYLVSLKEKDQLVLAGKTAGLDSDTFGLVIFKATDYETALSIMSSDPAVKNKIMIGKLQEYSIAIFNKDYKK